VPSVSLAPGSPVAAEDLRNLKHGPRHGGYLPQPDVEDAWNRYETALRDWARADVVRPLLPDQRYKEDGRYVRGGDCSISSLH
jgi:hypothetical protein